MNADCLADQQPSNHRPSSQRNSTSQIVAVMHRHDACAMALVAARHVCSDDIVVSMTRTVCGTLVVVSGEKGTRQGRQLRNLSGNLCMFCYDLRALPAHHLQWAGVGSGRPHWLILKADVR